MTRDEILAMEPGPELSILTAEHVLDKPRQKPGHGPCCTCQTCGYHHDDCVCWLSENLEEAWEVVEKMVAVGHDVSITTALETGIWVVDVARYDKQGLNLARAYGLVPEAICKAALLAVMDADNG